MESNILHRHVVARLGHMRGRPLRPAKICVLLLILFDAPRPAFAQFEFTGSWNQLATEDVSNDSVPVDYVGLPLTEEARAKALSYTESVVAMPEHQCEAWPPPYLITGPFGLKIFSETEPIKGTVVSYTIGGSSNRPPTQIWMDGRPHPSKYRGAHAQRIHDRQVGRQHAGDRSG